MKGLVGARAAKKTSGDEKLKQVSAELYRKCSGARCGYDVFRCFRSSYGEEDVHCGEHDSLKYAGTLQWLRCKLRESLAHVLQTILLTCNRSFIEIAITHFHHRPPNVPYTLLRNSQLQRLLANPQTQDVPVKFTTLSLKRQCGVRKIHDSTSNENGRINKERRTMTAGLVSIIVPRNGAAGTPIANPLPDVRILRGNRRVDETDERTPRKAGGPRERPAGSAMRRGPGTERWSEVEERTRSHLIWTVDSR
ncbi:hypothetical protein KM043_008167 [Ampulex compressa]|nr:hypothetical protein KM043_008167 [Ampulex compressa]